MLDDILAPLLLLFGLLAAPLFLPFVILINAFLALIELVLGLFFDGIELRRLNQRKEQGKSSLVGALTIWGGVLVLIFYFIAWPKMTQRELTIMTTENRPVMAALIEFEKNGITDHVRTNSVGKITVPRFGLDRVTMKDSRYVGKDWERDAITDALIVEPTILGAGIEKLTDQLLKPFSQKPRE